MPPTNILLHPHIGGALEKYLGDHIDARAKPNFRSSFVGPSYLFQRGRCRIGRLKIKPKTSGGFQET